MLNSSLWIDFLKSKHSPYEPDNGALYNASPYIEYWPQMGVDKIQLEGDFNVEQLEALIKYMKKIQKGK